MVGSKAIWRYLAQIPKKPRGPIAWLNRFAQAVVDVIDGGAKKHNAMAA